MNYKMCELRVRVRVRVRVRERPPGRLKLGQAFGSTSFFI